MLAAVVLLFLSGHTLVRADGPNRAGLVVQHGDGRLETACVSFEEPSISGLELLIRSRLDVTYEVGGGTTVCAIDNEGCRFPAEPCFCQCIGDGPCTYWSYWHLDPETGEWSYSQLGATAYEVLPGTVDGWRWGAGTSGDAPEPPTISFDQICTTATETPRATPTASSDDTFRVMPSVTSAPPRRQPAASRATPTNAPTFTPERSATPMVTTTPQNLPTEYVLFGLLVVLLIGGMLWTQRS